MKLSEKFTELEQKDDKRDDKLLSCYKAYLCSREYRQGRHQCPQVLLSVLSYLHRCSGGQETCLALHHIFCPMLLCLLAYDPWPYTSK